MRELHRDVAILGTGSALPERVVTNAELETLVRNYDSASGDFSVWVDRVTHIQERRWVDPARESAGTLGLAAARKAIERSGVRPDEIDQIVFCSFSYNELFPGEQTHIARDLGIRAGAFAMTAACAGTVFGMTLGRSLVLSGQCRNVLVIGSECVSRTIDLGDPVTAILFGDAAGAMVIGRKGDREDTGFLGPAVTRTEFNPQAITMRNGNCPTPKDLVGGSPFVEERPFLRMSGGPSVLRNAVNRMTDVVVECLGFTPEQLKRDDPELRAVLRRVKLVPHQANGRIVDGLQEKLGLPRENVYRTIYFAGNSSAGTNALTLDWAVTQGNVDRIPPPEGSRRMGELVRSRKTIEKGDLVVVASIGAGYVYGAVAFVHAYDGRR